MTLVEARRAAATAIRDNVPAQTDIRVFEVDVISARDLPNLIKEAEGLRSVSDSGLGEAGPALVAVMAQGTRTEPDDQHYSLHVDQEPTGAQPGPGRTWPWVGGSGYRGEGAEYPACGRAT